MVAVDCCAGWIAVELGLVNKLLGYSMVDSFGDLYVFHDI